MEDSKYERTQEPSPFSKSLNGIFGVYLFLLAVSLLILIIQFLTREPGVQMNAQAFIEDKTQMTDWVGPLLSTVVMVGILAMAFIQLIKPSVRQYFLNQELHRWLKVTDFDIATSKDLSSCYKESPDPYKDLLELTTSGYGDSLFQISLEQLCGQIIAVSEIVLDRPRNHLRLLVALTGARVSQSTQRSIMRLCGVDIGGNQDEGPTARSSDDEPAPEQDRLFEARNHLSQVIQRSLDAFQISAANGWKRTMKYLSFFVCYAIAFFGMVLFSNMDNIGISLVFAWVVSLFAAYVASASRDIFAVLERKRR